MTIRNLHLFAIGWNLAGLAWSVAVIAHGASVGYGLALYFVIQGASATAALRGNRGA